MWLYFTKLLYVSFLQERMTNGLTSSIKSSIALHDELSNNGMDYRGISSKNQQNTIYENNRKMDVLNLLLHETNLHEKINIINKNNDIFPPTICEPFISLPNITSNLNNDEFNFTNNRQEIFLDQDFNKLYFLLHA